VYLFLDDVNILCLTIGILFKCRRIVTNIKNREIAPISGSQENKLREDW